MYRALVENSMDVMLQTVGGELRWISPSVVDLLGWTSQELVGQTTMHLWHPDDVQAAVALRDQAYAGLPGRGVYRLRTKDDQYVWVETSVRPYVDEDGTAGAVGSMRDVTAQVETEQARAESEERFRLTMESASIGMCLESPDGRFVLVNPAMCQIMGRDAQRLMGSTWKQITHPDDIEVGQGLLVALAAGRIPSFRLRKRYLKPDRSVVWGDLSMSCVRNDDGTVRTLIAQIVDVTDQVRTQRALADSERHYRSLVHGASEAMYEVGPDHRLTWISAAITAILGWEPAELVGTVMADLVHPDDRRDTDERRAAVFAGDAAWDRGTPLRMRTKAGGYRWVSAWGKPVIDPESGALVQVVAGVQDVDELMTTRIRLQATLDTEFDPHVLLGTVRDHDEQIVDLAILEVNPAACAFIGQARCDLIGRSLKDMPPARLGTRWFEMLRPVVQSGEPLRRDDFTYELAQRSRGQVRLDIQAAKMGDGVSCTWRDVTDRYATGEALAASEETHRLLTENLSDVVVHVRHGVVVWVAPSVTTTLGWDPQDVLGHELVEFVVPQDLPEVETLRSASSAGSIDLFRVRVRAKDGTFHWVQVHAKAFYDRAGNQDGLVGSFRIIDPQVAVEAELERRARSDELTGLMNRREVLDRIAVITGHPHRTGEQTAVLFCDIDGFKSINDRDGHSAGDAVLQAVATRVTASLRGGDFAARFGGDELLVLLDGVHEIGNAVDIADNIRRAVAEPIPADGHTLTPTISVGVTLAVPGEAVDDMIARADTAMYQAKQGGGDRVVPIPPPFS